MTKTNPYDALPPVSTFTVTSTDVKDGQPLPSDQRSGIFGAGGKDISPQLAWTGFPAGTKSFAVTMYDPDAPTASGFWHWAVVGLPATTTTLVTDAGAEGGEKLPKGAFQLPNEARLKRFLGAAPPPGHGPRRYFIVVHALDVETLDLGKEATPAILGFQMFGHTLARGMIVPTSETPAK